MTWIAWAAIDFTTLFMILIFWQMFGQRLKRQLLLKWHPSAVAVLNIEGVLKHGSSEQSPFMLWWNALSEVRFLRPKALIIRINSPGGTVGASQELFSMIKRIRDNGTKVVALMEDVAASGGLYLALAADRIIAQPGTVTGSIGVIMQTMEYSAVLERFQIKVRTIKSGKHKDMMSPTREMTEEDRQILQDMVMNVYEQFCDAVATSRNLEREQVKQFADGRIFSGAQAFELGVVDEHGSFYGALLSVCGLAGIDARRARIVPYRFRKGLFGGSGVRALVSRAESILPDADLRGIPLWLMPGR